MKTIETEITPLESLVRQFLADEDEVRFELRYPHLIDGHLYASDAHKMIRVPAYRVNFEHTNQEVYIRMKTIWEGLAPNTHTTFDVQSLRAELQKIELMPETIYEECSNCKGSGEIEDTCHCCGHETFKTCKACQGSGDIEKQGEKMVPNYDAYRLDVHGVRFRPSLLAPLIDACKLENTTEIRVVRVEPKRPNLFRIGELDFLYMPDIADDKKVLKLTTQLPAL